MAITDTVPVEEGASSKKRPPKENKRSSARGKPKSRRPKSSQQLKSINHKNKQAIENKKISCKDTPQSSNNGAMKAKFNKIASEEISKRGKAQKNKINKMRKAYYDHLIRLDIDEEKAIEMADSLTIELKEIHLKKPPQFNKRPNKEEIGIIDFLRIHYRDEGWLDGRFTLKDLGKTNRSASTTLYTWLGRVEGRTIPKDLDLPKEPTLVQLVQEGEIEKLENKKNKNAEDKLKLQSLKATQRHLEHAD